MSWQSDLFCNITFNRATYNYKWEVEERLSDVKKEIQACENSLRVLAFITEPEKFADSDDSTGTWIENTLNDALEDLKDYTIEKYKLQLLLDNWNNCHNEEGLAIPLPEGFDYDSAFIDGDFIKTINSSNNE